MQRKRFIAIFLFVIFLVLAGCRPEPAATEPAAGDSLNDGSKTGEITDPQVLKDLRLEYINDAAATVGNIQDFHAAAEIDPSAVVNFCWLKYRRENGVDNLQRPSPDSGFLLFPLDEALVYVQRYFNLTSLDLSKIPESYYDPEKKAFTIPAEYGAGLTTVGRYPGKTVKNEDGTVTAELIAYNYDNSQLIDRKQKITLQQRDDGSYYFVSSINEFVNNHLVELSGDLATFPAIQGFTGNMQELSMIGEADGKLLLVYAPANNREKPFLARLDPGTMSIEKEVELPAGIENTNVKFSRGKIFIRLQDKVLTFDQDLTAPGEIALPETLAAKINEERKTNQAGIFVTYFGGYDISDDLSQIVYSDETGLKLLSLSDRREKLLSPTGPYHSFHFNPRFVAADQKVISVMAGYDYPVGCTLCDLEKGTAVKLDNRDEGFYGFIPYDTGILTVNGPVADNTTESGCSYKTLYLDFHTGQVTEIELAETGDTGYIRPADLCYAGQNQAAFVTTQRSSGRRTDDLYYLNRIDLKTLQPRPAIATVQAAAIHIVGVLSDGRVVFWYEYNPGEKGICMTL